MDSGGRTTHFTTRCLGWLDEYIHHSDKSSDVGADDDETVMATAVMTTIMEAIKVLMEGLIVLVEAN